MTLGQEFSGYAAVIKRGILWLDHSRQEICELGIGGSAAGTGLTVPKGFRKAIVNELASLTGEKLVSGVNLFELMQSQGAIAE